MSRVAVAGAGYVGLAVGASLSEIGHRVTCVDVDENKVAQMRQGIAPVYEPGLEQLMRANCAAARLDYSTDYASVYSEADMVFIAVGTPKRLDGSSDLSHVFTVARQIAESINGDCLVVVKSTVPVGTSDRLEQFMDHAALQRRRQNSNNRPRVEVASNPEFLAQGTAVHDALKPTRIVIGTQSGWAEGMLLSVLKPFGAPIISVNRKTAEMIKFAANSFLAIKISYMNDIAGLCELIGVSIQDVARGIGHDERIGARFLDAGIGYGGSCLPEDTKALLHLARQQGHVLRTVKAADDVNADQRMVLYRKSHNRLPCSAGLQVAVLGLTFKPGTDDVRGAPSLDHVSALLEEGACVHAYDPAGIGNFRRQYPEGKHGEGSIAYSETIEGALMGTDVCFVLTEWAEIRALHPEHFRRLMRTPLVYDGRNVYDCEEMRVSGVEYYSVGRT